MRWTYDYLGAGKDFGVLRPVPSLPRYGEYVITIGEIDG